MLARLKTKSNGIKTISKEIKKRTTKSIRITGTTLKNRRLKMWTQNPHCAMCGVLTDYPWGFELDHIIPLCHGGKDTEDNCQILCCDTPFDKGCHSKKTKEDLSFI